MRTIVLSLFFISNIVISQTDSISRSISAKINHLSDHPVHSILLYIENESNGFVYNEGFGQNRENGDTVTKYSSFKIASSTKLFVSTIILQLQEEGKLRLDDGISKYIKDLDYLDFENLHNFNGIKYADQITIKQLLSHRSGLADIFTDKEEAFFEMLTNNSNKQYSSKAIIDLYYTFNLNIEPHFKPNEGWFYSDINYVLLGLIIEKIDNTKLAQSIRNRILDPLEMKQTFFEYYENPRTNNNQINQYVGHFNFSMMNTSFDWAGGGLVSTNDDLALFIKALFNGDIITKESLSKMIKVEFTKPNESRYGLGVYEFIVNKDVYYGHFGFYNTFIGYCPKTKSIISYSISQATPDFDSYKFIAKLLKFAQY
ncbi:serine hydrolase domain-containing protein [Psychroserpens damuponensis]|uniref:serine hydrolase domain-containing protein n=1 Tax=Psychroserpens damuponensis TaxID=943936 RepID=UPI00058C3649|nr:serine hydrolase domain-containing protein [Psychroserpens damuponensis]